MSMWKIKKNVIAILLGVGLIASLFGCTIKSPSNGTTIRVNKEFKENEIFYLEEEICTVGETLLFLMNQKNLYTGRYGEEIWNSLYEGKPLYSYLEENLHDFMIRLKAMVLMAADRGLTLTEDDDRLITLAADDYWKNLSQAEKDYCKLSQDDVKAAFEDYFLANRLFASLTRDAQKEISDDEARVISLQVIFLPRSSETDSLELIESLYQRATRDKEDFYTLTETYSKADEIEIRVSRGELPEELEKAAFALSTGEISKVVSCEDGYYLVKCLSNFEELLTEQNREKLIEKWKQSMFKAEYDQYVRTLYMRFHDVAWDTINFELKAPKGKVSFYSCYDEFLAGNE